MDDCQAAQAVELVRALRHRLGEMTKQLAWVEHQDVTGRDGRARAMRMEAAALRRDMQEAEVLIDRLQRRYLNGGDHAPLAVCREPGHRRARPTRHKQ
jgi:hypothetical protein